MTHCDRSIVPTPGVPSRLMYSIPVGNTLGIALSTRLAVQGRVLPAATAFGQTEF